MNGLSPLTQRAKTKKELKSSRSSSVVGRNTNTGPLLMGSDGIKSSTADYEPNCTDCGGHFHIIVVIQMRLILVHLIILE